MSNFLSLLSDYLSTGYRSSSKSVSVSSVPLCEISFSNTLSSEEQELLEKMLSSINLYINQNCQIKIDNSVPQFKMLLSYGDIQITTHNPASLLQDSSLKRAAWEDLKFFKSKIGEI